MKSDDRDVWEACIPAVYGFRAQTCMGRSDLIKTSGLRSLLPSVQPCGTMQSIISEDGCLCPSREEDGICQ